MAELVSVGGLLVIGFSILFVGMAKAGIAGAGTLTIPILALLLGGKPSVGFLLPILLLSDVIAIIYYRQTAQWRILVSILPWAFVGVILAMIVGKDLSDSAFQFVLACIILAGIAVTVWRDFIVKPTTVPQHWMFSASMGLLAGFTSMMGNAAGPIITIFLLSMQLHKKEFAGTRAWYFFIMNAFKMPFHAFVWNTITRESLQFGITFFPALILGMLIGFYLVNKIPEQAFRIIILLLTSLSALFLFLF